MADEQKQLRSDLQGGDDKVKKLDEKVEAQEAVITKVQKDLLEAQKTPPRAAASWDLRPGGSVQLSTAAPSETLPPGDKDFICTSFLVTNFSDFGNVAQQKSKQQCEAWVECLRGELKDFGFAENAEDLGRVEVTGFPAWTFRVFSKTGKSVSETVWVTSNLIARGNEKLQINLKKPLL